MLEIEALHLWKTKKLKNKNGWPNVRTSMSEYLNFC